MKKLISLFIILFFFSSAVTFATKGRTDSSGCHNSKTDGYHCHNSGYTPTYTPTYDYTNSTETRDLNDSEISEYLKEGKQCYNIKNKEDKSACYKIQGEGDIFTHDEVVEKLKEKKNCNFFSKYKHNQLECNDLKKEIRVYSSVELRKITRSYSKCSNIKSFVKDYEICKQEKINKEEKFKENNLQDKIDSINKKIELFYNKNPKKIESIGRKLSKIKEKLDKTSDKYILINAIDLKIKELIEISKKKL